MNTHRLIPMGFLAGGLVNIIGVLTFSAGFTSDGLAQLQPALFSDFGLFAIILWGLAYIAVSRSYAAVPWLVAVFALEKLAYGLAWLHWMSGNSMQLDALFEQQPLSASFMLIYGPNDWAFCVFFAWVFFASRRRQVLASRGVKHTGSRPGIGALSGSSSARGAIFRGVLVFRLGAGRRGLSAQLDFYRKYQEIIADYNREKDRVTVEATFAQLLALATGLDAEERRAAAEGLSDDELALFDLLFRESISKTDRERLKQASRTLLASLRDLLRPMHDWTQNTATQAEVQVFILDNLWQSLPRPVFSDEETEAVASRVYDYVWQRSASGHDLLAE